MGPDVAILAIWKHSLRTSVKLSTIKANASWEEDPAVSHVLLGKKKKNSFEKLGHTSAR